MTHRYQIGKRSVADIRSMLRYTARMRIARVRQHGELTGELGAAIDGENRSYAPQVGANQFLTVAKHFYGLDPSD